MRFLHTFHSLLKWNLCQKQYCVFFYQQFEGGEKEILDLEPIPKLVEGNRVTLNWFHQDLNWAFSNTMELKSGRSPSVLNVIFIFKKITNSLPWSPEKKPEHHLLLFPHKKILLIKEGDLWTQILHFLCLDYCH